MTHTIKIVLTEPKEGEWHLQDVPKLIPASFDHVELGDLLDFIEFESRHTVLYEIVKLMKYGVTISITGIDLLDVARCINYAHINPKDGNDLLYGKGQKSISHINEAILLLERIGLEIVVRQLIDHSRYHLVGLRNAPEQN